MPDTLMNQLHVGVRVRIKKIDATGIDTLCRCATQFD